jgi:hypothetical protein
MKMPDAVSRLIHTSVDDCRTSARFARLADLHEALRIAHRFGHASRIAVLKRELRKRGPLA